MTVTTVAITLVALVAMLLSGLAVATLWWQLHAWRTPETLVATGFGGDPSTPSLSFSLLVPARHETAVLGDTLDLLAANDHPDFEIIAIIGHDDPETQAVADAASARHPGIVRVVIDHSEPKNKPKGMNTALPHCRGDVVGVFDAEDEVDIRLLRRVDAAFRRSGADVVQGGVQLMNFSTSWYSLRNCLEYFFWFRSRLHLHAEHRFIPLGGNTVFIKTDVLREAGGWDGECLAEDCDLGVRLSSTGHTVEVCYDPHLVTREETPDTIRSLVKQRTRWNQGFLQVLRKGQWKQLPPRQRRLARWTLFSPFLQAFTGVAAPAAVLTALVVHAPVPIALLTFVPMVPTMASLLFEIVALREFCRLYYVRPRRWDYVRLVLGTLPYSLLLSFAAVRAVVREARGQRGWEKTEHVGAHRGVTAYPSQPSYAPTGATP